MEIEELCSDKQRKDKGKNFLQRNFDWIAGTSTGAVSFPTFDFLKRIIYRFWPWHWPMELH